MDTEIKKELRGIVSKYINLGSDRRNEESVIESISTDVDFFGAKLWLLVIAVFVASLGLNINSTAVIIGAMLISPLMGPIIGIGLGVGIYDFSLLKRSFRNYTVATLFSIVTASLYFLITPINEAQSELLARTSPSIYDVGIALCGGLAGMIGVSSKSQRLGNVIPGVAIATALMPPLCTVGYGIANMKPTFIFGALYLYLINTVFIAFGTCICVTFILRFKKKTLVDKVRESKLRKYIVGIAIATIIPSIFLTLGIVQDTVMEQRVGKFIHDEMNFKDSQVVRFKVDHHKKEIQVMLLGNSIDSTRICELEQQLPKYKLENISLKVIQGNTKLNEMEILSFLQNRNLLLLNNSRSVEEDVDRSATYNSEHPELNDMQQLDGMHIMNEISTFYPQISRLILADGKCFALDSAWCDGHVPIVIGFCRTDLTDKDAGKIQTWLRTRLERDSLLFIHLSCEE